LTDVDTTGPFSDTLIENSGVTESLGSSTLSYTMSETANVLSGEFSETLTGYDRYSLLTPYGGGFKNVADTSGTATPGHLNFSPFGEAYVDDLIDYFAGLIATPANGPTQNSIGKSMEASRENGEKLIDAAASAIATPAQGPAANSVQKAMDAIAAKLPPLPAAPTIVATKGDWRQMFKVWYLELSGAQADLGADVTWPNRSTAIFGTESPYSQDVFDSVGMKEVQSDFFKNYLSGKLKDKSEWSGDFQFNGPKTAIPNYLTQVEWFLGSFHVDVTKFQVVRQEGNKIVFDIWATATNKTHWESGTRLPATWNTWLKEQTGYDFTPLKTDHPRGRISVPDYFERLANPKLLMPIGVDQLLPSFGGDWTQIFKMKGQWTLVDKKE
jgi:hypothetical protein